MAKIRNKNGEDRETQYGVAVDGGLLEVPDEAVYGFTCQSGWDAADKDATAAHNKGERAEKRSVNAETKAADEPPPGPEAAVTEPADG